MKINYVYKFTVIYKTWKCRNRHFTPDNHFEEFIKTLQIKISFGQQIRSVKCYASQLKQGRG